MDRLIASPPPPLRRLCALEEVPEGGAKGFPPSPGSFYGLFAVRTSGQIAVYVNACPHLGVPLDWAPDRFLSADRRHIVCATHGALFRTEDGGCVHGPCYGAALTEVLIQVKEEVVWVAEPAGP
jgi:naringenin degradation protein FdeD